MALDRFAPEVQHLTIHIEEEIEAKRNSLERDKGSHETAFLRGYIKGLRKLLVHINGDDDENDPDS